MHGISFNLFFARYFLKAGYRGALLGSVWIIVNPLITFSINAFVFHYVLKLKVEEYFIFLVGGLFPWIFFSRFLGENILFYENSREFLLSFPINPLKYLACKLTTSLINFFLPLIAMVALLEFQYDFTIAQYLLLPVSLVPLIISTFFVGNIIFVTQIFLRDVQFILSFLLTVLYLFTPIFYPETMIPEHMRFLLNFNFIYFLIKPTKSLMWENNTQGLYEDLLIAFAISILIFIIHHFFWTKIKKNLYYYI